jgi:hypothetical protein
MRFTIKSAQRLKADYEDGPAIESDPFEDWLQLLHFTYDRPDEHSDHAVLEATPHEVTLHLQNEGWSFEGRPEYPPYKFTKAGQCIELEPVKGKRTKITKLESDEQ